MHCLIILIKASLHVNLINTSNTFFTFINVYVYLCLCMNMCMQVPWRPEGIRSLELDLKVP